MGVGRTEEDAAGGGRDGEGCGGVGRRRPGVALPYVMCPRLLGRVSLCEAEVEVRRAPQ